MSRQERLLDPIFRLFYSYLKPSEAVELYLLRLSVIHYYWRTSLRPGRVRCSQAFSIPLSE